MYCFLQALVQFEECEKKFQKLLSEGSAAVSDIELASHLVQVGCHACLRVFPWHLLILCAATGVSCV